MWPCAHGGPVVSGQLRIETDDFRVDEELGFTPDGDGEHWLLHVEKRGANTHWVAGRLAQFANVAPRLVSYSGLKDRHAVTRQWFSVHLPGKDHLEWSGASCDEFSVITAERHGRKLRRGSHRNNRFRIRVRNLSATGGPEERLDTVSRLGVPNYFGEQRFGRGGANLGKALAMFTGKGRVNRHHRSIYLSAARSWLFNRVLAVRVLRGTWNEAMEGDVFSLEGTRSVFAEIPDDPLRARIALLDVHPTGPLWGRAGVAATGQCLALESGALAAWPALLEGLETAGLKQERRALRLKVQELEWHRPDASTLELQFTLGRGAFATSVLREIVAEG